MKSERDGRLAEEKLNLLSSKNSELSEKVQELEADVRIEREWRIKLQQDSVNDKETISNMTQENTFLQKVADVSKEIPPNPRSPACFLLCDIITQSFI